MGKAEADQILAMGGEVGVGVEVEAEGEIEAEARALEQMRVDKQALSSTPWSWRLKAKDTALPGECRLALASMIDSYSHIQIKARPTSARPHTSSPTPHVSHLTRHRALSLHHHNG